jgi:acetyltransferase
MHSYSTDGFLAQSLHLKDGRAVALRAARPDDAAGVQQFVRGLSQDSRRNRFFSPLRELTRDQLDRVLRTPDPRDLTLVAATTDDQPQIIALAQHVQCEPGNAEFAIVVGDTFQRKGLGLRLIGTLAEHAAQSRRGAFAGFVLADNWPMLALLARLGFELAVDDDPYLIRAVKPLDAHGLAG